MNSLRGSVQKALSYAVVFLCGGVIYWLAERSMAEIPRSSNRIDQPVTVKLSRISPEDNWIQNLKIDAASLHRIDSNRRYLMLIFTNKTDISSIQFPSHSTAFRLKGTTDKDAEIRFSINPSQLEKRAVAEVNTLLLDLGGQLFGKFPILLSDNVEIYSAEH